MIGRRISVCALLLNTSCMAAENRLEDLVEFTDKGAIEQITPNEYLIQLHVNLNNVPVLVTGELTDQAADRLLQIAQQATWEENNTMDFDKMHFVTKTKLVVVSMTLSDAALLRISKLPVVKLIERGRDSVVPLGT